MSTELHAVMPYGRAGASARVRVFDWAEHLGLSLVAHTYLGTSSVGPTTLLRQPLGILTAQRRLGKLSRQLNGSSTFPLIVHRECSPLSDGGFESRLLRSAPRAIYDLDDAMFWQGSLSGLRRVSPKPPKVVAAMRAADMVIVGNETLADFAAPLSRHTVVIPSCVEPARYRRKTSWENHDPPRLFWLGTPSGSRLLVAIAAELLEVHRRTGARLTVVGAAVDRAGPLIRMIDLVPWTEQRSHELPAEADIGIMPLDGRLSVRGKCGYKLLQYGAAGLPAIASPVGTNRRIIADLGYMAVQSEDWVTAIEELLSASADTRRAIGEQSRAVVEGKYSYQAWSNDWFSAVYGTSVQSSNARLGGSAETRS
jgi:glycosyltransferase involved in cell wall biosynthesis